MVIPPLIFLLGTQLFLPKMGKLGPKKPQISHKLFKIVLNQLIDEIKKVGIHMTSGHTVLSKLKSRLLCNSMSELLLSVFCFINAVIQSNMTLKKY